MQRRESDAKRVLGIYPATEAIGFAVFEGFPYLIDYGLRVTQTTEKNPLALRHVEKFLYLFKPEVVVLEDCTGEGSNKSRRIAALIEDIQGLCEEHGIDVRTYTREQVRASFGKENPKNKFQVVQAILSEYPEFRLKEYRPQVRQSWMSEDIKMSIFDAIALALTFYRTEWRKAPKTP